MTSPGQDRADRPHGRRPAGEAGTAGGGTAAYLYVHEVICAGCKKPWTAGHVCPTPPRPWWKR